jgi:hypothetical protein
MCERAACVAFAGWHDERARGDRGAGYRRWACIARRRQTGRRPYVFRQELVVITFIFVVVLIVVLAVVLVLIVVK